MHKKARLTHQKGTSVLAKKIMTRSARKQAIFAMLRINEPKSDRCQHARINPQHTA